MFTGIIDHCGTIARIENFIRSQRLWIESHFSDLVIGESIAVDGACLTVVDFKEAIFYCDVSSETRELTTTKH